MIEVIEKARELAKEIQNIDEYKKFESIKNKGEEDEVLKGLINKMNLVQINIKRETSKQDLDEEKVKRYKEEEEALNIQIKDHPVIKEYDFQREVLDELMDHIYKILIHGVNGGDVDSYSGFTKKSGGGCGSCKGGCGK